jgi:putative lipoic acid-binding regulatory protein
MMERNHDEEATELMQFPCEFPLKVFGLNEAEFEQEVMQLVRGHCAETTEFVITRNQSRQGKYQSLTITFTAHSRQQLDDIYLSLSNCDLVVMSL